MTRTSIAIFFAATSLLWSVGSFAQTKNESKYVSAADRDLTIKSIGIVPVTDNMDGIYSNPLSEDIDAYFQKDLRWKTKKVQSKSAISDLEKQPAAVKTLLKENGVDAILLGRVIKGPLGMQARLALFSGPDGGTLLLEESPQIEKFETAVVRAQMDVLLRKLLSRMPYQGFITSRRALEVTINMGTVHGITPGSDISVLQILKANRHPKLGFLIGTEKEILGKIRILKADEQLSFGQITFEKEAGLLEVGMKVLPDQFVQYPVVSAADPLGSPNIGERKDAPLAFGNEPREWVPEGPPQYGRFGILAGLGPYVQTVSFTGAETVEGNNNFAPSLGLQFEGWMSSEWFIGAELRQSVFTVGNSLTASTPDKLNMSTTRYDLAFGRNFLLSPDFFGPRLLLSLGYSQFTSRADESTPILFSNMSYGGMRIGFDFNTPLSDDLPFEVGGRFRYFLWPTVSESKSSGYVDSISMNEFAFTAGYRTRQRFRYLAEMVFYYENADFSGTGDRAASVNNIAQRSTVLSLGLEYLF